MLSIIFLEWYKKPPWFMHLIDNSQKDHSEKEDKKCFEAKLSLKGVIRVN